MAEEDYLKDLNEALEMFQTYFPEKREDIDIIVLRGHQLAESLLYKFIKQNVRYPEYIDSFFIRWEPLVALVRAMKNEKTKEYKGLMVPVRIIIDLETRKFEIEVKTPPTSQLILRELGLDKGSDRPKHKIIGNLTIDQVIKIARIKRKQSLAKSLKGVVKEVLGTCVSMGVTVDGKDPRIVQKEIDEGKYNIPEE